jgi:uncharacterized protein
VILIAALIGCVSLLYATAGQAGGTAFLAIMAFAAVPADQMRPTALLLNVVAASYATWRLHQAGAIDHKLLLKVTLPSLVTAFAGGLLVLGAPVYFVLTGLLLIAAAALVALKRATVDARASQRATIDPTASDRAGSGNHAGVVLRADCSRSRPEPGRCENCGLFPALRRRANRRSAPFDRGAANFRSPFRPTGR